MTKTTTEELIRVAKDLANDLEAYRDDEGVEKAEAIAERLEEQAKRIEELKKALEFYADKDEWHNPNSYSYWKLQFNSGEVDGDGWTVAHEALKKLKENKNE